MNKDNIGWLDSDKINMKEYYIVEYWSNKFGVKPEVLKEAVKVIGARPADVRKYLNK